MNSLADLDSETRRLLNDKQSMAALRLAEKAASLHPKSAAAVDEIDAGQPILERDLLRAQVLFDCERVVRPAFDRRVVGAA